MRGQERLQRSIMWAAIVAFTGALSAAPSDALGQARIKDLATIEGIRENQLVGQGLVLGLAGTGDGPQFLPTRQALDQALRGLGGPATGSHGGPGARSGGRTAALVTVTANLPPFARPGQRIDVTVSALGDARSLAGGSLLPAELMGAEGQVIAVAEGAIIASGFAVQGNAARVVSGTPTIGRIPGGAIVEVAVDDDIPTGPARLVLRNPDLTTAARMAAAVNQAFGPGTARAANPSVVELKVPTNPPTVEFLAAVEQLRVTPDGAGTVVLDGRTGTILTTPQATVSPFAVTQGQRTVRIIETPQVSQPSPFSGGTTVVVPRTQIEIDEGGGNRPATFSLQGQATVVDLVRNLTEAGFSAQEISAILQAAQRAGAIQGQIR